MREDRGDTVHMQPLYMQKFVRSTAFAYLTGIGVLKDIPKLLVLLLTKLRISEICTVPYMYHTWVSGSVSVSKGSLAKG
jgi:hypothetical protein